MPVSPSRSPALNRLDFARLLWCAPFVVMLSLLVIEAALSAATTYLVIQTSPVQNTFGGRSLTGVNMGDNTNIANLFHNNFFICHNYLFIISLYYSVIPAVGTVSVGFAVIITVIGSVQ